MGTRQKLTLLLRPVICREGPVVLVISEAEAPLDCVLLNG